jgi:hypothetical protein
METIAVYWESKIRTYGFNLLEGLGLHQIDLPADRVASWGWMLQSMADNEASFRLVWFQRETPGQIKLFLLCDAAAWGCMPTFGEPAAATGQGAAPPAQTPADVICFHGPHFGDRYGIMDFTYRALAKEPVPLLGVVCSVATIYLVVPAGWGNKTQGLLMAAFEIPKSVKQ